MKSFKDTIRQSNIINAHWEIAPYGSIYCTHCQKITYTDSFGRYILSEYCPHCGAKMIGGNNDGESSDK